MKNCAKVQGSLVLPVGSAFWLGLVVFALTPRLALALTEDFRTNTLTNTWTLVGTSCLTAGDGSDGYVACTEGTAAGQSYTDSDGEGWLRLTPGLTGQGGRAIFDTSFLLSFGFDVTFTYAMYAGSAMPADGMSLFLVDPNVPGAGGGTAYGGNLGFCGMIGGVLGVGLDAYGNFASAVSCPPTGPGPTTGQRTNISVRGGMNATPQWRYLGGTGVIPLAELRTDSTWAFPAVQPCGTTIGEACLRTGKRIHVSFYPDATCPGANEYRILVESITDGITMENLCVATADLGVSLSTEVQLGFAAGTGTLSQYQEIRDIVVFGTVADLSITKSYGTVTYEPGSTDTYTIVVNNFGPFSADGSVLVDPAITGFDVSAVACVASSGGALCPTAPNLSVAALQSSGIVISTLPPGSSLTFEMTGIVPIGTTGTLINTASITPPVDTANSGVSCTAVGSTFDSATGTCIATATAIEGCADDAECAVLFPAGNLPFCIDIGAGMTTCVACLADADCGGATSGRICSQNTCVNGCAVSDGSQARNGCPAGLFCSVTTPGSEGQCSSCGDDAQCAAASVDTPFCVDIGGGVMMCAACRVDADCGIATSGRICSSTQHACVDGCAVADGGVARNGCPDALICSATTPGSEGECLSSCTNDAQCAAASPSTPFCLNQGGGVAICVMCIGDATCAPGQTCDLASHSCLVTSPPSPTSPNPPRVTLEGGGCSSAHVNAQLDALVVLAAAAVARVVLRRHRDTKR